MQTCDYLESYGRFFDLYTTGKGPPNKYASILARQPISGDVYLAYLPKREVIRLYRTLKFDRGLLLTQTSQPHDHDPPRRPHSSRQHR